MVWQVCRRTSGSVSAGPYGEVALLHSVPRSATVSAAEKVKVWALDRNTFQKCLSAAAYKRRKTNEELLAKVKLLEELDDYKRAVLADALVPCTFAKGEVGGLSTSTRTALNPILASARLYEHSP